MNELEKKVPTVSPVSAMLQEANDGKWYCDLCDRVQESKDDLLVHRILHFSNERSKQCPLCQKTFSTPTTLRNHLTVHTGIKKYRCKFCSRKFGWKTQLAIHENLHTGKGLHHCPVCSKSFMTKWLLQRHIKIHDKKNSKRGSYKMQPPQNLQGNAETANLSDPGDFHRKCQECFQKFKTDEDLAYHLLSHNISKHVSFTGDPDSKQSDSWSADLISIDSKASTQSIPSAVASADATVAVEGNDLVEMEGKSKNNLSKNQSKGSLTSIVSKLHHKVDEKQKFDNEELAVVERSVENYLNVSLSSSSEGHNTGTDFVVDVLSKQAMVKRHDPFISGMYADTEFSGDASVSSVVSAPASLNYHDRAEKVKVAAASSFRQQLSRQKDQIENMKKDIAGIKTWQTKEFSSLHTKIDCLTNLVSSQSLILNRILLGGKMSVSGTLDFSVQQHNISE